MQGVVDFLAVQWRSLGVAEIAGGLLTGRVRPFGRMSVSRLKSWNQISAARLVEGDE